jgi:hypothetical protein
MPSFQMHLAVSKKYLQKNEGQITNIKEFFNGTIAPDLTDDKMKTHYSLPPVEGDFISNIQNKVDVNQLFKLPIDNDFEKGVFLHLLTDYIFYNYYFTTEFLKNTTHDDFSANLYASYDFTTKWLDDTYGFSNIETDFNEQMKQSIIDLRTRRPDILSAGKNILTDTDKLVRFIDFVSSFDLQELKDSRDFGVVNF